MPTAPERIRPAASEPGRDCRESSHLVSLSVVQFAVVNDVQLAVHGLVVKRVNVVLGIIKGFFSGNRAVSDEIKQQIATQQ